MEWQFSRFGAKVPGVNTTSVRFPPPPRAPVFQRDSFLAVHTDDVNELSDGLQEYWTKISEILPAYYAGDRAPDPRADEVGRVVAPDNGWNRVVFTLDVANGKL